jgi:hypothetical protein
VESGTNFSDGVRASTFAFARVRHDRSPTSQTFIYSHSDLAKTGFIETKELLRPKGWGLFAREGLCRLDKAAACRESGRSCGDRQPWPAAWTMVRSRSQHNQVCS